MCRVLHIYQQRSGCAMSSRPEMIAPHWVLIFNELPILERQVLNHSICIHIYFNLDTQFSLWDFSSPPGVEPILLAVKVWSPNP